MRRKNLPCSTSYLTASKPPRTVETPINPSFINSFEVVNNVEASSSVPINVINGIFHGFKSNSDNGCQNVWPPYKNTGTHPTRLVALYQPLWTVSLIQSLIQFVLKPTSSSSSLLRSPIIVVLNFDNDSFIFIGSISPFSMTKFSRNDPIRCSHSKRLFDLISET